MISEHKHATKCPRCGYAAEFVANLRNEVMPGDGDCIICLQCGCFNIFDDAEGLRLPTALEAISLAQDPMVQRLRLLWEMMVAFAPVEGHA
jgi:hypothetical protein